MPKPQLIRQFQFRMSAEDYRALETASKDTGLSPSLIVRLALKKSLKEGAFKPFSGSPPGGRDDG